MLSCRQMAPALIGIGGSLATPALPHHPAYGSVPRRFGWSGNAFHGERGDTQLTEISIGQGHMKSWGPADPPWTFGTAGCPLGEVWVATAPSEFLESLLPSLPLGPNETAQSTPDPRLKFSKLPGHFDEVVVPKPSLEIVPQLGCDFHPTAAYRASRQLSDLCPESSDALRSQAAPRHLLGRKAEAQELTLRRLTYGTLRLVDFELELGGHEALDALHPTQACPLATHIDILI